MREQYAERELAARELEEGLAEVVRSDDPDRAVREYERDGETGVAL